MAMASTGAASCQMAIVAAATVAGKVFNAASDERLNRHAIMVKVSL